MPWKPNFSWSPLKKKGTPVQEGGFFETYKRYFISF